MLYGADFGVRIFLVKSVIPVTLGNMLGDACCATLSFWYLYDRPTAEEEQAEKRNSIEEIV